MYYLRLKYYHPTLNIGMQDIRNVWLLESTPVKLQTVLHRGALAYRFPQSGKRISYRQLKKGLLRQDKSVAIPLLVLPF